MHAFVAATGMGKSLDKKNLTGPPNFEAMSSLFEKGVDIDGCYYLASHKGSAIYTPYMPGRPGAGWIPQEGPHGVRVDSYAVAPLLGGALMSERDELKTWASCTSYKRWPRICIAETV